VTVNLQLIPWGHKYRKENSEVNRIEREKAEVRKRKGLPVEYFCKSLYLPKKGGFFSIPHDKLGIGTGACSSCEERNQAGDEFIRGANGSDMIRTNIAAITYVFVFLFGFRFEHDSISHVG